MDWDDVIYLTLLVGSIFFGHFFRCIKNLDDRKNISTVVGVIIILVTSRLHALHCVVTVVVNWCIITFLNKRIIHVSSFVFSFLYLFFFRTCGYFGIPFSPAHTNLIMMILTLKVVGLAYELHDSLMKENTEDDPEYECTRIPRPSLTELFHYSFCYIGVLTGPYYSYRTYWDLFNTPFGDSATCLEASLNRARFLPLYAVGFLMSSHFFPFKYIESDAYVEEASLAYRLFYILPVFFTFRMRMYIGMRLSECVCIMAGLGAYPEETFPKPGRGPTKNHGCLYALAADTEKAKEISYSFETVYNMEPYVAEYDMTVRYSMKAWNMTVQYWLAANVYKRFPIKAYRMPVTFLVSSLWHGMHAGHYMCLCSVPFYLPIEDIYIKNLQKMTPSPLVKKAWFVIAYTWRMLLMGYWGTAFSLLYAGPALRFWTAVYFIPALLTIVMYIVSRFIWPPQRKSPSLKE